MATHFLIACSNRKAKETHRGLEWGPETTIEEWSDVWRATADECLQAREMYMGDSFSK